MPASAPRPELSAVFLGPKGENADTFERLLLETLRDHVFWRRNFHPEDGFSVSEAERRRPGYEQALGTLSQELMNLLGELKGGVPFFSPRHIGHMAADLTMASLIGYIATLLYNPNNVASEASPVTTRLEAEVAEQLARMVGYRQGRQWGHLASGGTIANAEALWAARTVKYLPVSLRWVAEEAGLRDFEVTLADGRRARTCDVGLWELLNVAPAQALSDAERLGDRIGDPRRFEALLSRHSLANLGGQNFGRLLAEQFGDPLPSAAVLVPGTAHYSWEKTCRAIGIGGAQLVRVPVDERFRMNPEALEETVARLARARQPILACISVVGSTEESAVDRVDRIADVRERAGREHGAAFWLHADAAWGGYAASITRASDASGSIRPLAEVQAAHGGWPDADVYASLTALGRTDSITIDPHKLGFVPYPAGALCYRDGRVRYLLSSDAPYVFQENTDAPESFGRFILEGSRPGAAAAAVWMSHRILPLDESGYGDLIGRTAEGARALHRTLTAREWSPFSVAVLPAPDLNIVCFAPTHPSLRTLEESNAFVDRIHRAMSLGVDASNRHPDYFVSRTVLRVSEYGGAGVPVAERLGFDASAYERAGGVHLLRSTVMDPFLTERRSRTDFLEGFADALADVMRRELEPRPVR